MSQRTPNLTPEDAAIRRRLLTTRQDQQMYDDDGCDAAVMNDAQCNPTHGIVVAGHKNDPCNRTIDVRGFADDWDGTRTMRGKAFHEGADFGIGAHGVGAPSVAATILINLDRAGDGRMLEPEEADRIYDSIVGPLPATCPAITYGVEDSQSNTEAAFRQIAEAAGIEVEYYRNRAVHPRTHERVFWEIILDAPAGKVFVGSGAHVDCSLNGSAKRETHPKWPVVIAQLREIISQGFEDCGDDDCGTCMGGEA